MNKTSIQALQIHFPAKKYKFLKFKKNIKIRYYTYNKNSEKTKPPPIPAHSQRTKITSSSMDTPYIPATLSIPQPSITHIKPK